MATKKPPAGWDESAHGLSAQMRARRVEKMVTRKELAAYLKLDVKEVAALEQDRREWPRALISAWIEGCNRLRK